MKLLNPSYTIFEQQDGLKGIYKQIELAGRTCYKSEDKITDESAEEFVQRMINSGHTAMLEHGSVYLYIKQGKDFSENLKNDPFSIGLDVLFCKYGKHYTNYDTHETFFTTNLRWLVEKYPEDWKKIYDFYGRNPDNRWPMRRTVKLTTSLHVYKDITRHRTMSFAIESTRFCNYSKGKFGNELTFIPPVWLDIKEGQYTWNEYFGPDRVIDTSSPISDQFIAHLIGVEKTYMDLINLGWQAQQAAEVLPQCVKADVVITGFEDDWKHIFNLRALGTTGAPHPEVKRIFEPIMNDFIERKWLIMENKTNNAINDKKQWRPTQK
jgi:thymidylate synthase (FAD)